MHTRVFARARDDFQKSRKISEIAIFKKCVQKLTKAKFQVFGVFFSLIDQYEIVCTLI